MSKSFEHMRPVVPHLIAGSGGISGEIKDLRHDINEAFGTMENLSTAGTSPFAIEEWTNPAIKDDNFFLLSTSAAATVVTATGIKVTATPPRNVEVHCTVTGTGAGNVVVAGTDINGAALTETFAVPAATGAVAGAKAFATVTTVTLPILTVGMTVLVVKVGTGVKIGLAKKASLMTGIMHVISEYIDGTKVTTGTFAIPATGLPNGTFSPATAPDGVHDYAVMYVKDMA
jgi:hypothetical protein